MENSSTLNEPVHDLKVNLQRRRVLSQTKKRGNGFERLERKKIPEGQKFIQNVEGFIGADKKTNEGGRGKSRYPQFKKNVGGSDSG